MDEAKASRVLITGAGGQIGSAFTGGIKLTSRDLDVTNCLEVKRKIRELNPSAIIHLANRDLRQCERDPLMGLKTNVHATQYIIEAARESAVPLMFVSSSCIFNGPKGSSFDESSRPEPLNFYAEAKVISEEMILREYPDGAIIVRTGWVFGGHGANHLKFVDVAIEKCKKNEPLFAGENNDGSPTYVVDLVREMTLLVLQGRRGIFHIANSGRATPRDIANFIRQELDSQSSIEQLQLSEIDQNIKRSACEVLTSKYLMLRPWREALREYIQFKTQKL